MEHQRYIVIDFDSTFTKKEALDVLGEISLEGKSHKNNALKSIVQITNRGMDGQLSFRESLHQRIALLEARKDHLPLLIERLKKLLDAEVKDSGEQGKFVPHNLKLKMQWDKFSTDSEAGLGKLREEMLLRGEDVSDIEFEIGRVESIQKSLKLLANTFYGKSGDFRLGANTTSPEELERLLG